MTTTDEDGTAAATTQTEPAGNDAPQIVSVFAMPETITEGGSMLVIAIVTDVDGDLVGGQVVAPDLTFGYSQFEPTGAPDTFQVSLSWSELNDGIPIEFSDGGTRDVAIAFFDGEDNVATEPLTIALECPDGAACYGECNVGECHPLLQPCEPAAHCLWDTDQDLWRCYWELEGDGDMLSPCEYAWDCLPGLLCLSECSGANCCVPECKLGENAEDTCPDALPNCEQVASGGVPKSCEIGYVGACRS